VRTGGQSKSAGRVVAIEVAVAVKWHKEEGCYYAWSPQLRCVRDGGSVEEALAMCREALEVLLESLIERGTLNEYLCQHGYKLLTVMSDAGAGDLYALSEGNLLLPAVQEDDGFPAQACIDDLYKETITPQVTYAGA
jgi:predicted RNase H-like HicB family nuclease